MNLGSVDTGAVAILVAAFLLGGFIKGLAGIGLPMVALPVLSLGFTVPQAVALTMVPILVSNGWQAISNGALLPVIRRFWPMQVTLAVALALAASLMVRLDNSFLLIAAGGVLVVAILGLILAKGRTLPPRLERPVGVGVGIVAGMIGGVSSLFGIPIIIYMSSLGLSRAEFLTSISIIYFFAGSPYLIGLLVFGAVEPVQLLGSAFAVIPAMTGLGLASLMTQRIADARFRQMLNGILILLGLTMILRGLADV